MFNFENIHKNKKWAYTDGFLCGLAIAYFAWLIKQDIDESPNPFKGWWKKRKAQMGI